MSQQSAKHPTLNLAEAAPLPGPRLYQWADLAHRGITFTNRGLKKLEIRGDFPPRVRLSQQRIAWDGEAVDQWIMRKIREAATSA